MDNWTTTASTSSSSSSIIGSNSAAAATVTVSSQQEQQQLAVQPCQTEPVSSITPPPQPRAGQPPARVRRRVRRRRRTGPRSSMGLASRRRLFQNISQEGNQRDDANISSAHVSDSTPATTAVSTTTTPTIAATTSTTTRGNLAVRGLFREPQPQQQQQQLLQQVISGRVVSTTGHTGTNTTSNYSGHHCDDTLQNYRNYLVTRPINNRQSSVSIVEANRRLIERQIEAIRQADSSRWNFDFGNCRPLNQIGHRYVGCTTTSIVSENNSTSNYNNNNNTINIDTAPNMSGANQTPSTAAGQLRNIKPLNDKNQTQDH